MAAGGSPQGSSTVATPNRPYLIAIFNTDPTQVV